MSDNKMLNNKIVDKKLLALKEFIEKFIAKDKINDIINFSDVVILNDGIYLKKDDLSINAKIIYDSNYSGTILGRFNNNKFVPSFMLLEILFEFTDKKVLVNDKAEWLFSCGRDVFSKSYLTKAIEYNGEVIVLNGNKEVLGLGYLSGKGVTNIIDRGDFLRREMHKKKKRG